MFWKRKPKLSCQQDDCQQDKTNCVDCEKGNLYRSPDDPVIKLRGGIYESIQSR
jgi:hypothetical protein